MTTLMLKIPSHPNQITEVEVFVKKMAQEFNIGQEKFPNILISLTEAVNNAIIHGNCNDENKFVDIQMNKTSKGVSCRVSDEGCGFNPKSIPDPTADDHLECCGGRGVFLIQQLSDRVDFFDNGRTVEMHFVI